MKIEVDNLHNQVLIMMLKLQLSHLLKSQRYSTETASSAHWLHADHLHSSCTHPNFLMCLQSHQLSPESASRMHDQDNL